MEWIRTSIETTSLGVEVVTGALMACGINSVEIIDAQERANYFADNTRSWDYADEALMVDDNNGCAYVLFYVTHDNDGECQLTKVEGALEAIRDLNIGTLAMRRESANDETWLNEWKKHFTPITIGNIVVVPEWESYQAKNAEIVFRIDPGSAFGTGQHQTTQLCIKALQEWVKPQHRVLDIGCGSGILSIISMLLGASFVYAVDTDPAGAMAATKRNASLNPVDMEKMKIFPGDVLTDNNVRMDVGGNYDIVVANIVADVVAPLASIVADFTRHGGLFIASGIITERLHDVTDAFTSAGISVLAQDEQEGWHCIVGQVNA